MEILGILWSDDVIDKLARLHTVADDEVEEVFLNGPDFDVRPKETAPARISTMRWDRPMQDAICLSSSSTNAIAEH